MYCIPQNSVHWSTPIPKRPAKKLVQMRRNIQWSKAELAIEVRVPESNMISAIRLKVGKAATDQSDLLVCHFSLRDRRFLSRAPFATSLYPIATISKSTTT
jgi:hypothetical protein